MANGGLLTSTDLAGLFSREIASLGGTVKEIFNDGVHLLARSVLARTAEVKRGDKVQAGVALRARAPMVFVHPYVLRQVCTNGSVMAHALETRAIDLGDFFSPEQASETVAEAISLCASPEAFSTATRHMRSALQSDADLALSLMPLLNRLPAGQGELMLKSVVERFFRDRDRSRYGLFNAVTSVARDTRDPHTRWRLEEFGGGLIIAAREPKGPARDAAKARAQVPVAV
jgi:hypothetical protein